MAQPTVSEVHIPGALGILDEEEIKKLDLETFREHRTDAELENAPKYWRQLLAASRYLGNSAYPALKADKKWGDWTLKDVLSYFGKIVDTLRRDCRFLLTPPNPGEEAYGTSFWEAYREADKRGFITVPPPKNEAEEKKWQDQRAKILKADETDNKVNGLFAALPDDIVVLPKCVSLTGSYLYGKGKPNDVDFVLRQSLPGGALLKLDRTLQRILGTDESIQFILEEQGAVWDNLPLYDLVLRKRSEPEIECVDSKAFQEEFYKAALVTTPGAIHPGVPIKHYGVAGEYYLPHEIDQAWEKWGRRLVDKGEKIAIQIKFDGFRLTVSNSKGVLKVFTENGIEQSKVFPGLAELLNKVGLKDAVLDTEFVQYETIAFKKPESRTQMAWMGSAKEPREVPVTVFVHDLMWHNGKNIADKPYLERLRPIKDLRKTEGRWRIMIAPTKVVNTRAGFRAAVEWAEKQKQLSSEGAMAKLASFKYDPVKAKTDIIKLKRQIEIDARVIGYRKIFAGKPEGTTWTRSQALSKVKELREASKTYQLRVALKDEDTGRLIPVEAFKRLGEKDVKLDYDEKEQTWTGIEDPKLWVMFPPFKDRKVGELAYGNTYNIALDAPPQNGQIATVAPMEVTIFTQDGKAHVSFQHPRAKNLKPKGSPVGTIQSALIAHNKKPGGYGPWVSISKAWNWIKIMERING